MSATDIRVKVGEVRRDIVEFLISSVSPRFVIFDEWHKYKRTCFTNKLLERFVAEARISSTTKLLLVSATPFSVEYKEGHQGEAQLEERGSREGLLQMVWGKANYLPYYQRLRDDQAAYVEALASHLKNPAFGDGVINTCRDAYQRHLRDYCARTERPRAQIENVQAVERLREGDWMTIAQKQTPLVSAAIQQRRAS